MMIHLTKLLIFFDNIEEKLKIDLNNFTYESKGEEYLKTKVSDETCIITRIIKLIQFQMKIVSIIVEYYLQIQSVYYSMKDKDDIKYYPQVLIEQCGY